MQLKTVKEARVFFDMLPIDWQESLGPHWKNLKKNATIYSLEHNREICAGGIIFSTVLPEMQGYINEANHWFSKNYLYIGYVWVPPGKRNKNYGSLWLKNIQSLDKKQLYWLTTEDKQLRHFYEKAGFTYLRTLNCNNVEEDLFVSNVNQ
jgi:hypothetical protein